MFVVVRDRIGLGYRAWIGRIAADDDVNLSIHLSA